METLFTLGWVLTSADEDAIMQVPVAWKPGITQYAAAEEDGDIAEIRT